MKATLFYSIILFTSCLFLSCNDNDNNPLSAADKLTGKYRTIENVRINIKTDFCSNTLEDVAYEDWMLIWEVNKTVDPGIPDITMIYYRSGFTITNSGCGGSTGYIPEPSPMFVKGYINGDTLTIKYTGKEIMKFDVSNYELIKGSLKYSYCSGYCQEIYTSQTNFELKKDK